MKKLKIMQVLYRGPATPDQIRQATSLSGTEVAQGLYLARNAGHVEGKAGEIHAITNAGRVWIEDALNGVHRGAGGRKACYYTSAAQIRPCMCCGRKFESEGKHNRLCLNCKDKSDAMPQVTVHV